MARIARVVVPGLPPHVTQRGNRRQQTFFVDEDCAEYRRLLAAFGGRCGTTIWAYCLMPNHVRLVIVPSSEDWLRCALGEAHRCYTRTGRPVGSEEFIKGVEARLGRVLRPRKSDPKARSKDTRTRDMFPGFGEE